MSKIRFNTEGKIKLFLSTLLFICSLVVTGITEAVYLVFLPMFASSIGDINIMASRGCCTGYKEDTFENGVIAFAAAHLLYITAMQTKISHQLLIVGFVFFAIVVYFAISRKRILACVFYGLIILLDFINSTLFHPLAMVGMIFFIISDVLLAIFEDKGPWWQIPIWIFYVAGQICIITSFLLV